MVGSVPMREPSAKGATFENKKEKNSGERTLKVEAAHVSKSQFYRQSQKTSRPERPPANFGESVSIVIL